jgi:DNA replication and repair protein RecF
LVRSGAGAAVLRADVVQPDGRHVLVEAEVPRTGRARVQVGKQRLARARDLLGTLRTTVFAPDDLAIVKAGPAERRRFLDATLVALAPRLDTVRGEVERVLRQRNALLKQAGGRLTPDIELTLDVWDAKLAAAGTAFGDARAALVADLEPLVTKAYGQLAGGPAVVGLRYEPDWRRTGLAEALAAARTDDLRRQVTTVGPHRDDLEVELHELSARLHASQGEQRSLALALRLAAHDLVGARVGSPPVLLLDDVFSELDPDRSAALLEHLPPGQVIITTAGSLPERAHPARTLHVVDGTVRG